MSYRRISDINRSRCPQDRYTDRSYVTHETVQYKYNCCVKNCRRTKSGPKRTYFSFPKDDVLRKQWLNACQRDETNMNFDIARVCSLHFEEDCLLLEKMIEGKIGRPKETVLLKENSIPTKMLILERKRRGKKPLSKEARIIREKRKYSLATYEELVQYAQGKQSLSLEEYEKNIEINAINVKKSAYMERDVEQIEQNIDQNIEQNIVQNIQQYLVQNIDQNPVQNIVQNIQQNLVQNIDQNLIQNIDENIMQNIEQNIVQNIQQNIIQNIEQNVEQHTEQSEEKNEVLEQDIVQDIESLPYMYIPVFLCAYVPVYPHAYAFASESIYPN
ncbi:ring-infected erythrocyte surface antigen-like isoform X1 [Pogonomyrmex barbatus]|uniref:Ring-infected erythrocyte surface antigen-like isoform X1 n=2 Tax=Pogonomyrmex barbatus TaxID=144034 RepID=A0A6I9WFN5_9HYME|nr:ring-infected erythrocyte surface antigen-like isoform X1 [Pogonomyrmex barbatus]